MEEDKVINLLKSILVTERTELALCELQRQFRDLVGKNVPYKEFGYKNLCELLVKIPGVVFSSGVNGEVFIAYDASNTKAKHIQRLVAGQKQKRKKMKNGVARGFDTSKPPTQNNDKPMKTGNIRAVDHFCKRKAEPKCKKESPKKKQKLNNQAELESLSAAKIKLRNLEAKLRIEEKALENQKKNVATIKSHILALKNEIEKSENFKDVKIDISGNLVAFSFGGESNCDNKVEFQCLDINKGVLTAATLACTLAKSLGIYQLNFKCSSTHLHQTVNKINKTCTKKGTEEAKLKEAMEGLATRWTRL